MDKLRMTGEETTGPGEGVTVVGGIGVSVGGTDVNVGEGIEASHTKVDITCAKTTDSAALSNSGGGGKAPFKECKTKSMLMQALFLRVE